MRESGNTLDAVDQRVDIAGRRAAETRQEAERFAGADHGQRLTPAKRKRPYHRVADQFDQHPASTEGDEVAEFRIAANPDDDLNAVWRERLHHARNGRRLQAELSHPGVLVGVRLHDLIRVLEADRHQAIFRPMRDIIAHRLQDHRITDRRGGSHRVLRRRHQTVLHRSNPQGPDDGLGVDLVDRPSRR